MARIPLSPRPTPPLRPRYGAANNPGVYWAAHRGSARRRGGGGFFAGANLDMRFDLGQYFGAQPTDLTVSRASQGYAQDNAGNWLSFNANVARIAPGRGLLCEEGRTNSIRNSSLQGVSAGSPGTLPTGWGSNVPTGLTRTLTVETINGIEYLRIRYTGTATSTAAFQFFTSPINEIAAAQNQTWSAAAFIEILNATGVTGNLTTEIWSFDGAQAFLTTGTGTQIAAVAGARARLAITRTIPDATAAFIRPVWRTFVNTTSGTVVDFEIRIGWPQAELGAFITSPIRTTGAAAARAADTISILGAPFTALFTGGTSGTIYAEGFTQDTTTTTNPVFFGLDDQTTNNRILIRTARSSGAATSVVVAAGAVQPASSLAQNVFPTGVYGKAALAFAPNDLQICANGQLGSAQTSLTIPSGLTGFRLGQPMGTQALNGYLRRIAYFPVRQPNAALVGMTLL